MVWRSLDFIARSRVLCVQARARHVCACWRHAARPGAQALLSYSPKTMHLVDGCVCGVGGVSHCLHVLLNARLYAHQLRACTAHLGCEWQRLGRPVGRDRHRFTSPPSSVVRVLCHTAWPSLDFIACLCAMCAQARVARMCECWRQAAARGMHALSSY